MLSYNKTLSDSYILSAEEGPKLLQINKNIDFSLWGLKKSDKVTLSTSRNSNLITPLNKIFTDNNVLQKVSYPFIKKNIISTIKKPLFRNIVKRKRLNYLLTRPLKIINNDQIVFEWRGGKINNTIIPSDLGINNYFLYAIYENDKIIKLIENNSNNSYIHDIDINNINSYSISYFNTDNKLGNKSFFYLLDDKPIIKSTNLTSLFTLPPNFKISFSFDSKINNYNLDLFKINGDEFIVFNINKKENNFNLKIKYINIEYTYTFKENNSDLSFNIIFNNDKLTLYVFTKDFDVLYEINDLTGNRVENFNSNFDIDIDNNFTLSNFSLEKISDIKKKIISYPPLNLNAKSNLYRKTKLNWYDSETTNTLKKYIIKEINNKIKPIEILQKINNYTIYDLNDNEEYTFSIEIVNIEDFKTDSVLFPSIITNKYNNVKNTYAKKIINDNKSEDILLTWDGYDDTDVDLGYKIYIETFSKVEIIKLNSITNNTYTIKNILQGENYVISISILNEKDDFESEIKTFTFNENLFNKKFENLQVKPGLVLNDTPIKIKNNYKISISFKIFDLKQLDTNIFHITNKPKLNRSLHKNFGETLFSLWINSNSTLLYTKYDIDLPYFTLNDLQVFKDIEEDVVPNFDNYYFDDLLDLNKNYTIDIIVQDTITIKIYKKDTDIVLFEYNINNINKHDFELDNCYIYTTNNTFNSANVILYNFNIEQLKDFKIKKITDIDIINKNNYEKWNKKTIVKFNETINLKKNTLSSNNLPMKIIVHKVNEKYKNSFILWPKDYDMLKNNTFNILLNSACEIFVFCNTYYKNGGVLYDSYSRSGEEGDCWIESGFELGLTYINNKLGNEKEFTIFKTKLSNIGDIQLKDFNHEFIFKDKKINNIDISGISQKNNSVVSSVETDKWIDYTNWSNQMDNKFGYPYNFYYIKTKKSKIIRLKEFMTNNNNENNLLFILINPLT